MALVKGTETSYEQSGASTYNVPLPKPPDWDPGSVVSREQNQLSAEGPETSHSTSSSHLNIDVESGIATVRLSSAPQRNVPDKSIGSIVDTPASAARDKTQSRTHNVTNEDSVDPESRANNPSRSKPSSTNSSLQSKSSKQPLHKGQDLDNISIISDIPLDPNAKRVPVFRTLSVLSEDSVLTSDTSELGDSNNNGYLSKQGNVPKKVSWNDNVIITTTNSDNVQVSGLHYYESDTGSEISSTRSSNNGNGKQPSSPIVTRTLALTSHGSPSYSYTDGNQHVTIQEVYSDGHPPASRVYPLNRARHQRHLALPIVHEFEKAQAAPPIFPVAPLMREQQQSQQEPIVDEYEVAEMSRRLGSRTPDSEVAVPQKHKLQDNRCIAISIVLVILALLGLLAIGILYAIHAVKENPIEVSEKLRHQMGMSRSKYKSDRWIGGWHSNVSFEQILYLVEKKDMMPWQKPPAAGNTFMAWHRGAPLVIHYIDKDKRMHKVILGDPVTNKEATIHLRLRNDSWYAADLMDIKMYSLVSFTSSFEDNWKDMEESEKYAMMDGFHKEGLNEAEIELIKHGRPRASSDGSWED